MTAASTIRLIAVREMTERLKGRATWILTGITTLIVVGLIVIPALVRQPARPTVIGLVGPTAQGLGSTLDATARAAKVDVTTTNLDSDSVARSDLVPTRASSRGSRGRLLSSLQGGKATIDVALRVDSDTATIEVYQTLSPTIGAFLRAIVNQAHHRA